MARPMTSAEIVRQLRKWHVPYREVNGWETHNRNHVGAWGPVHGFIVHHTGDDAPDTADLQVILRGRVGLPGPLAQFGCDDAGTIWLIGWGRANHAGGGDPRVLRAVMRESYAGYPPAPHEHTGSAGATDGNDNFYGVETFYSGSKAPTAEAMRSLILLAAAICDFHGWSAKSTIGHKEWSDWKIDPGHVDMRAFRRQVQRALDGGPVDPAAVYLTRTRARLLRAHRILSNARRSLDIAIKRGAKRGGMRDRLDDTITKVGRDADRLRKDDDR